MKDINADLSVGDLVLAADFISEHRRGYAMLREFLGNEDEKQITFTADGVNSWGGLDHPKGTEIHCILRKPNADEQTIFRKRKEDTTDSLIIETTQPEKWKNNHVILQNGSILSLVMQSQNCPEYYMEHENRRNSMIQYLQSAVESANVHT